MRIHTALLCAILVSTLASVRADGLLYRLPEDGSWARYSARQAMTLPKGDRVSADGTLTLASVGQEQVDNTACRWIEIVMEAKLPGGVRPTKSVFKALIPENRLSSGQDPLGYWVRGWVKMGEQQPQALTRELLANPAMMLNLLVCGPLRDAMELEAKAIETKLGKLTCEGLVGTRTLKGASVRVKDRKKTTGDIKVRMHNYFHDRAPFGVVSSHLDVAFPDLGDGKASTEIDLTLLDAGTGASSELPEQK
jgi:hypothetical protein